MAHPVVGATGDPLNLWQRHNGPTFKHWFVFTVLVWGPAGPPPYFASTFFARDNLNQV